MNNIVESNKLIVEFMGGLWGETSQKYGIGNAQYLAIGTFKNLVKAKHHYSLNELLYHSDWNWLMEVVEKIESLGYKINNFSNNNYIYIGKDNVSSVIINEANLTKKEAFYKACVEFIKWYNENN